MAREDLGDLLPHARDAQGVDETLELALSRTLNAFEYVLRGLLRHALEAREGLDIQAVQVGGAFHQVALDELVDQLLAQALDIHGAARGEMQQGLLALRLAVQPAGAACCGLARHPHHRRGAHRAFLGHREALRRPARALALHADDFRNDIAGAAHDDRVADPDILAPELVLVVQGRVGDGGAAHEHRLEARHRGQGPGAPHLHVDTENLRGLLLRRILVGQRKARRARHEAEPLLRIEPAHRAGGGVARVDVLLFSQLALARVEGVEVAAVHQDLAAHLELARVRGLRQAQRNRAQRTQVRGDVLARSAVAARGSLGEQAVAVGQADRQAVKLRLRGILHCIDFERLAHAPVEGAHRFLVESVGDGQHRRAVPDFGELGQRRPAHPLCGRVRSRQFGMRRFQGKKLLKQPVIFGVIDLRLVLDVVEPVMVFEGFPESFAALPDISRHAHENSRSASGLPGSMPSSTSMCRTASTSVPMAASARSSTGLPLSSTRRAPCAAASWRPLRAIAWKLRAGSGVRTTSSVRVMPSSRGVTWKACSPASISAIAAPTTCNATWMSAWAHTRSRLRAASSAWRISGAETLAPTFAASVSTSERNSSSSLSLATPARVTNCNAALQPPPFEAASKTRFAKRCSSGAHSSSRLAAAIPRGAARTLE